MILLVLLLGTLEKLNIINVYSRSNAPSQDIPEAKTTSTAPSAQDDFTNGGERQVSTPADKSEGVVKDNNGSVGTVPNANQWTRSSDGKITVYSPEKSLLIASGFTLSGASSYQKVNFRLVDNASGVISQGSVNVLSGKFSGTFSFTSKGTEGRLDVFYANEDGVESSNVSVPVRYK